MNSWRTTERRLHPRSLSHFITSIYYRSTTRRNKLDLDYNTITAVLGVHLSSNLYSVITDQSGGSVKKRTASDWSVITRSPAIVDLSGYKTSTKWHYRNNICVLTIQYKPQCVTRVTFIASSRSHTRVTARCYQRSKFRHFRNTSWHNSYKYFKSFVLIA